MLFTLFTVALLGLLSMTWLFPLTARIIWRYQNDQSGNRSNRNPYSIPKHIAVLIPAHNEQDNLVETLTGVQKAIRRARCWYPQVKYTIHLGADGCSDQTVLRAISHGVDVVRNFRRHGKWETLKELTKGAGNADWIAFVDCGVRWQQQLLLEVMPLCSDSRVVAVAPSYQAGSGGLLQKIVWSFERHLKSLEGLAGGPISLHGATMFFRRRELMEVFDRFGHYNWLNDDVVIPLALRLMNPQKEITYLSNTVVYDTCVSGNFSKRAEFVRRKRMLIGNLQWILGILPIAASLSPAVYSLALRRVFRLFWAYWGSLLGIAFLIMLWNFFGFMAVLIGVMTAAVVLLIVPSLRSFVDAAGASFLAPFYLLGGGDFRRLSWR